MTLPEPQALNSVMDFHRLFGAYIWDKPHIPDAKTCELRINLLQEELNELKDAIANNDLTEVADALTDMQYVLSGAVISFGLQDFFVNLFDEVQRSNMSKACTTQEEAQETIKKYESLDQQGSIIEKNGVYLVLREMDKKVLKSVSYSPANLQDIIHKYTENEEK